MRADFHRTERWYRCGDITVRPRGDKAGDYMLARALVAAGLPDDDLQFYDERGRHSGGFGSFHRAAKWDVAEDNRGLRYVKYAPSPWAAGKAA